MGKPFPSGATRGWHFSLCVFVCFEVTKLRSDAWKVTSHLTRQTSRHR